MLNYTFLFVIFLAFLPMGIVIYLTRQEKKATSPATNTQKLAATARQKPSVKRRQPMESPCKSLN